MFQNVLGSDGRMHLERQLGNQRIDFTTGGGSAGTPSATTDKVFLLSTTEVYGDLQSDGAQYEYYKSKGVSTSSYSGAASGSYHWTRSVDPSHSTGFRYVGSYGAWRSNDATYTVYVFPAFSF